MQILLTQHWMSNLIPFRIATNNHIVKLYDQVEIFNDLWFGEYDTEQTRISYNVLLEAMHQCAKENNEDPDSWFYIGVDDPIEVIVRYNPEEHTIKCMLQNMWKYNMIQFDLINDAVHQYFASISELPDCDHESIMIILLNIFTKDLPFAIYQNGDFVQR